MMIQGIQASNWSKALPKLKNKTNTSSLPINTQAFSGRSKLAKLAEVALLGMTLTLPLTASIHSVQAQEPGLSTNSDLKPKPGNDINTISPQALRKMAQSPDAKRVQALASKLGELADKPLRKELTTAILNYQKPDALKMHQQVLKLNVEGEQLEEQWDAIDIPLQAARLSLAVEEKAEKPNQKTIDMLKGKIKDWETKAEPLQKAIEANVDKTMAVQLPLDDINQATGMAIKHGLSTFTDDPKYVEEQMSELLKDPRGKVRNVAAFYLQTLSNDKRKAQLITETITADFQKQFYPPGSANDVDAGMIASSATKAAISIKDEALRLKVLTHISKQPWSTGKNAVSAYVQTQTEKLEQYKDIIVNVSSAKIPGHFMALQNRLTTYPKPLLKSIVQDLLKQGLDQPDDRSGTNYSRGLGVSLLPHLDKADDAFKLNTLQKAVADRHEDVQFNAAFAGFPFAEPKQNQVLLDFYLNLTNKQSTNPELFQSVALQNLDKGSLQQPEIIKTLTKHDTHEHRWIRQSVAIGTKALQNPAEQRQLLDPLAKDKDPEVQKIAQQRLKQLQ